MPPAENLAAGLSSGRVLKPICLLWIAGFAMRMTILVITPVIPMVHDELHLSETQVGLLIGLPLALFAIAAVPGSLLTARLGATLAVTVGMVIAALAGAARGAAIDVWTLYAAAIMTGFGISIMQPGVPALAREWLPRRIALGTIAYTSGMLMGATIPTILSIPYVLPLLGGSWRLDLVLWAVPALLIAPVFFLASPQEGGRLAAKPATAARWWPDWTSPRIWILGLTFATNNSPYFATNAFLGDYLTSQGKTEALGLALFWLNAAQILAFALLLLTANRLQQRAWPFLLLGPLLLAAFLGMIFVPSAAGIVVSAGLVGFTTAFTLTATLALPAFLSAPGDVHRTAAGMFTISYACAVAVPTICGALWDLTGRPWTAFVPLCICAVGMTVLGTVATRLRPATE